MPCGVPEGLLFVYLYSPIPPERPFRSSSTWSISRHMRMSRIRTRAMLAAAVVALFGLAPAAASQPFFPVVGAPIPYEVSLPVDWANVSDDDAMLMLTKDDAVIIVAAADLMDEDVGDDDGPMTDAELKERRRFTQELVGSDEMLLGMLNAGMMSEGLQRDGLVQEIRTLGGRRSAYLRGRVVEGGESEWVEMHVTAKDGIMYMLAFVVQGESMEAYDELFGRIQASFVLAK